DETLGGEGLIARGILWRYVVAGLAARRQRPLPWTMAAYDASLPPAISESKGASVGDERTRRLARLIEPLELKVSLDAPERVNLLVPEIELKHFFGGYITKFNLARRLAERGVRTRILTVD